MILLKMDGFEKPAFEGRTMLMSDPADGNCQLGMPVLVKLTMRQATTAHGRVKAALVIPVEGEPVPMPFAEAVTCGCKKKPHGWTPEFRLEMN